MKERSYPQINVELDRVGRGKVVIGDYDISDIIAGVELVTKPGDLSRVKLVFLGHRVNLQHTAEPGE